MISVFDTLALTKVKQETKAILDQAKAIENKQRNNLSPEDFGRVQEVRRKAEDFLASLQELPTPQ